MKNYGKAVIYSTSGSVLTFGSVTGGDKIVQSEQMTNNGDYVQITGQDNEVIGFIVTKERKEITVTFMPAGGSTNTRAKAIELLSDIPSSISKVTLSGMVDTNYNGDYVYQGGANTNVTSDGFLTVTLPLTKYVNAQSDATTLTTLVTG